MHDKDPDPDGDRLTLSKIAAGEWRPTFARDAMTSVDGYGVAPTPWREVRSRSFVRRRPAEAARKRDFETLHGFPRRLPTDLGSIVENSTTQGRPIYTALGGPDLA